MKEPVRDRKNVPVRTKVKGGQEQGSILSGEQKKKLVKQKLREKKNSNIPRTAQQSIPYQEMFRDGICRVDDRHYTKCIMFGDINYQLAQNEDKTAAFEYWCDFYNYFDPSIYDIQKTVNDIAKIYVPNESEDTLALGLFGYIADIASLQIQNDIILNSELGNELWPSRAKYEKNVIAHSIIQNITDINAKPAIIPIMIGFEEEKLKHPL